MTRCLSPAAAHVRVLAEFLSLRSLPGSGEQLRRDRAVQVREEFNHAAVTAAQLALLASRSHNVRV